MTLITAIDPGPHTSGYVVFDTKSCRVERQDSARSNIGDGGVLDEVLFETRNDHALVIEGVTFYGQRVGREVYDAIKLIGAVEWVWRYTWHNSLESDEARGPFVVLTRPEVIRHFCGVSNAPKGQVNAALYDRFGGSRQAAMGTKKHKGPLHGVTGHALDALALAVAYAEGLRPKEQEPAATVGDALAAVGGTVEKVTR